MSYKIYVRMVSCTMLLSLFAGCACQDSMRSDAHKLDRAAEFVDRFGTISIGGAFSSQDNANFKFDFKRTPEQLFDYNAAGPEARLDASQAASTRLSADLRATASPSSIVRSDPGDPPANSAVGDVSTPPAPVLDVKGLQPDQRRVLRQTASDFFELGLHKALSGILSSDDETKLLYVIFYVSCQPGFESRCGHVGELSLQLTVNTPNIATPAVVALYPAFDSQELELGSNSRQLAAAAFKVELLAKIFGGSAMAETAKLMASSARSLTGRTAVTTIFRGPRDFGYTFAPATEALDTDSAAVASSTRTLEPVAFPAVAIITVTKADWLAMQPTSQQILAEISDFKRTVQALKPGSDEFRNIKDYLKIDGAATPQSVADQVQRIEQNYDQIMANVRQNDLNKSPMPPDKMPALKPSGSAPLALAVEVRTDGIDAASEPESNPEMQALKVAARVDEFAQAAALAKRIQITQSFRWRPLDGRRYTSSFAEVTRTFENLASTTDIPAIAGPERDAAMYLDTQRRILKSRLTPDPISVNLPPGLFDPPSSLTVAAVYPTTLPSDGGAVLIHGTGFTDKAEFTLVTSDNREVGVKLLKDIDPKAATFGDADAVTVLSKKAIALRVSKASSAAANGALYVRIKTADATVTTPSVMIQSSPPEASIRIDRSGEHITGVTVPVKDADAVYNQHVVENIIRILRELKPESKDTKKPDDVKKPETKNPEAKEPEKK